MQKLPCITVVADSCADEYQGGQFSSNNCRALPWWLDTAVNETILKKAYPSVSPAKFNSWLCLLHLEPVMAKHIPA